MSDDPLPEDIRVQLYTASDSRSFGDDRSGTLMAEVLSGRNYEIAGRSILREEYDRLFDSFRESVEDDAVDVIISSGGTGISSRDRTIEAVSNLLDKTLPGFGQLFRELSYEEIGPYTVMSRCMAGRSDDTLIIALPGSPNAVTLAFEEIILDILPHMVKEIRKE